VNTTSELGFWKSTMEIPVGISTQTISTHLSNVRAHVHIQVQIWKRCGSCILGRLEGKCIR